MGMAKPRTICTYEAFESTEGEENQFEIQIDNSRRDAGNRPMDTLAADHTMAHR